MNLLLVQTGFLGDVVLSTPVIGELQEQYPDASLTVLTTPAAVGLIRHHPFVQEVISFDKRGSQGGLTGLWSLSRELRQRKFAKVFSLHKSYRTAALLRLAGIPERFGFEEASASYLYTKTVPRSDLSHEVLRNLAILRAVGFDPVESSRKMEVHIPTEVRTEARSLLGDDGPWIGMSPGSVWATKQWTPEGFAATADHFHSNGYRIVLLGGPDDLSAAAQVEKLSSAPFLNLVGKTSLLLSAAVIGQCSLMVTNDSSPLHMASALQVPVVAAFCATVPEFGFGPWQVASEVVGVDGLSCRPCGRHGGNTCPTGTHDCQRKLSAGMVIAAAERLLAATQASMHDGTTGHGD